MNKRIVRHVLPQSCLHWRYLALVLNIWIFPVHAANSENVIIDEEAEKQSLIENEPEKREDKVSDEIHYVENPEDRCDRSRDTYDYEKSWYDDTQSFFNGQLCLPAVWFDSFFADDRIFAEGAPGTYVRWRNEFTYDEEEAFKFKTALSFSAELPALSKQLRLTFESGDEDNLQDIVPDAASDNKNNLGLQLDLNENVRSKFSVSASFSPRIRFRYRYTYPLENDIVLRFTQEVQNQKGVNSGLSRFDFEKLFYQTNLLRMSTEVRVSEKFDGFDWAQTLVVFKRLSRKSSLSYESSVNGITLPNTRAVNFRLGVRYRRNFHRKWLFYEVAPEVTWPTTLDENRQIVVIDRRSKWLIFLRLEVHFGNARKRQYENYY